MLERGCLPPCACAVVSVLVRVRGRSVSRRCLVAEPAGGEGWSGVACWGMVDGMSAGFRFAAEALFSLGVRVVPLLFVNGPCAAPFGET